MIKYFSEKQLFVLETQSSTYAFMLNDHNAPMHVYYGAKLISPQDLELTKPDLMDDYRFREYTRLFKYRHEYATYERGVYDEEALKIRFSDGVSDVDLTYDSHKICDNKLLLTLKDEAYSLKVVLTYEVFENFDIIKRYATIVNNGEKLDIEKCLSATFYLPYGEYISNTFAGNWSKEFSKVSTEIAEGKVVYETRRGVTSGPHFVPFVSITDKKNPATENSGGVYFASLAYSGNFKTTLEKNHAGVVKIAMGINDFDTVISLGKNESFTTPDLYIGYVDGGYNKMSEKLYDLQFDYLCPRGNIDKPFPIIYNSWYPYLFDVNEEKLLALIPKIKEIGAELFVIDDGWFTNRIDDRRALGDWQACKDRFPNGLGIISDKAHEAGLLFGLWVEPEMINEDSELYSLHPDWVLRYETRPMSKMRSQMVLDITKPEVYEFCKNMLDRVITEYKLDYLKWDMNRYIAETGKDSDFFVKYTQALWGLYKHIRYTYPSLLIENCAHGGARSDYGMMPYSDRINRSDNSDPVDVLKLHEGFSTYILPRYAGGAGNVATSPNGQNGRVTPLKFRAHLGMTGSMSVGFDLLTAKKEDIEGIKEYIKYYKTIRPMLHSSYLYRISSALDNGVAIWQYTARDRSKAVVFIFAHGVRWGEGMESIKLVGLKPNSRYEINGKTYNGDTLMKYGYYIRRPSGDYYSEIIEVTEIN